MLKKAMAGQTIKINSYPHFAPRIWHGMSTRSWLRLITENRFAVDRIPMAFWVTYFSLWNSLGNRIQSCLFRPFTKRLPLVEDPIFIIGHWRTGTTLLHTLTTLDERFATPNNYQVFTPGHFLFTEWFMTRLLAFPSQRPMDNMEIGWKEPQEEEHAICAAGLPSVYANSAFPRNESRHIESLDMSGSREDVEKHKKFLLSFIENLNWKYRRPLILKSPTNTGRIGMLLELFPNAKFIHITRDPMNFIPSTLHLWRALGSTNAFQLNVEGIDETDYVFECFHRLYDGFSRDRDLIPEENFHELRYEELTSAPEETLRTAYEELDLPTFDEVEPAVTEYMEARSDYQRNKHVLSNALVARIYGECGEYMRRYGYVGVESGRVARAA